MAGFSSCKFFSHSVSLPINFLNMACLHESPHDQCALYKTLWSDLGKLHAVANDVETFFHGLCCLNSYSAAYIFHHTPDQ